MYILFLRQGFPSEALAQQVQLFLISQVKMVADFNKRSNQRIIFYSLMILHLFCQHFLVPEALDLMEAILKMHIA